MADQCQQNLCSKLNFRQHDISCNSKFQFTTSDQNWARRWTGMKEARLFTLCVIFKAINRHQKSSYLGIVLIYTSMQTGSLWGDNIISTTRSYSFTSYWTRGHFVGPVQPPTMVRGRQEHSKSSTNYLASGVGFYKGREKSTSRWPLT